MKTNRRNFLKLSAAAASVGPTLLLPRFAHATPGFGLTKHVLVLYAKGGFRSHCTFNAVGEQMRHNPFGVAPALAGRQWALGAAAGDDSFTGSLGTVPSFRSISNEVTVLGCVDHTPGESADVDHRTAANRIATGRPDGMTGALAMIGRDHPMYENGFTLEAVPPVEINPTEFGIGSGSFATTRPLAVASADAGFAGADGAGSLGEGWKMQARAALDERFRARRSRSYRPRISQFLTSKANAATFAEMLQEARLQVLSSPDASDAGVTNAQLIEVLGDYTLDAIGDPIPLRSWGADVALALRFFSYGSPMAVVTRDIYDMHDAEQVAYVPRTRDLVRQLAGLNFLLKAMPHPTGGTYWDHSIVCVVSEFSRNNTTDSGFNSGAGSDHVGAESGPARNQAVAMMGGPISGVEGQLIGSTDDQIDALEPGLVFSSRSLLATLFDAIGVDPAGQFPADAPISELYS